MALQRTAYRALLLKRSPQVSNIHPTIIASRYYASDTQATAADGASEKTPQNAEPKILNRNPPAGEEEPKEVAQHNKNIEQRAEKPAGQAKNEDAKDDKVSKGFWSGE